MTKSQHIVVVDDDQELRELIAGFLTQNGFTVSTAAGGEALNPILANSHVDLIVLDLMMPGEDGLALMRRLRGGGCPPIIMLSAMGEDSDRIIGLEVGADDYLAKPCNPRELLARIRAVLRRGQSTAPTANLCQIGQLGIDLVHRRIVTPGAGQIALSDAEFRVLAALLDRPLRVVTRDQLIEATRGISSEVFDRAIDVTMSRLRKKLNRPDLIRTIRNEGYMLTEAPVG